MREVKERALLARAKRYYKRTGEEELHKVNHRLPWYGNTPNAYVYFVDVDRNVITWEGTWENFISWCYQDGILKWDEYPEGMPMKTVKRIQTEAKKLLEEGRAKQS